TRDAYFDNNTVAFNNCERLVGVQNSPPQNDFRNIWFRNNIFWRNTGAVRADAGINLSEFHFVNNLWERPYPGDSRAMVGDPQFVDPEARAPDGYKIVAASAARDRGMLLYENPLDFWNGTRPHRSKSDMYDIGAVEFGTTGTAKIGL